MKDQLLSFQGTVVESFRDDSELLSLQANALLDDQAGLFGTLYERYIGEFGEVDLRQRIDQACADVVAAEMQSDSTLTAYVVEQMSRERQSQFANFEHDGEPITPSDVDFGFDFDYLARNTSRFTEVVQGSVEALTEDRPLPERLEEQGASPREIVAELELTCIKLDIANSFAKLLPGSFYDRLDEQLGAAPDQANLPTEAVLNLARSKLFAEGMSYISKVFWDTDTTPDDKLAAISSTLHGMTPQLMIPDVLSLMNILGGVQSAQADEEGAYKRMLDDDGVETSVYLGIDTPEFSAIKNLLEARVLIAQLESVELESQSRNLAVIERILLEAASGVSAIFSPDEMASLFRGVFGEDVESALDGVYDNFGERQKRTYRGIKLLWKEEDVLDDDSFEEPDDLARIGIYIEYED